MDAKKFLIVTWIFLSSLIGAGLGYLLGINGVGQRPAVGPNYMMGQPSNTMAPPSNFAPPMGNTGVPMMNPPGGGTPPSQPR